MTGSRRLSWFIEAYVPAVCGLLALGLLWVSRGRLLPLLAEGKISVSNLFSAVFGWASIQTGCVFAIYGFVAGKADGFIGEVRHTRSMRRFTTYIKRAIISGFILTIFSMPLMVLNFQMSIENTRLYLGIAAWFSVFVWAFLSFARVAYIFGLLVQVEDVKRIPGG